MIHRIHGVLSTGRDCFVDPSSSTYRIDILAVEHLAIFSIRVRRLPGGGGLIDSRFQRRRVNIADRDDPHASHFQHIPQQGRASIANPDESRQESSWR